MRLRVQSFISIVRQPVGWFDRETNSPGRLSTRLARDAPLVKAAVSFFEKTINEVYIFVFSHFFVYRQVTGSQLSLHVLL